MTSVYMIDCISLQCVFISEESYVANYWLRRLEPHVTSDMIHCMTGLSILFGYIMDIPTNPQILWNVCGLFKCKSVHFVYCVQVSVTFSCLMKYFHPRYF